MKAARTRRPTPFYLSLPLNYCNTQPEVWRFWDKELDCLENVSAENKSVTFIVGYQRCSLDRLPSKCSKAQAFLQVSALHTPSVSSSPAVFTFYIVTYLCCPNYCIICFQPLSVCPLLCSCRSSPLDARLSPVIPLFTHIISLLKLPGSLILPLSIVPLVYRCTQSRD